MREMGDEVPINPVSAAGGGMAAYGGAGMGATSLLQQQAAVSTRAAHLQQAELEQKLQSFWVEQMGDVEHARDFKNHLLPLARIKKIMKSDEDVRMISAEAPVLFAKACEMFILELTHRAWTQTEEAKRRTLQRSDISTAIQKTDIFDFLIDIVPRDDPHQNKKEMIGLAATAGVMAGGMPGAPGGTLQHATNDAAMAAAAAQAAAAQHQYYMQHQPPQSQQQHTYDMYAAAAAAQNSQYAAGYAAAGGMYPQAALVNPQFATTLRQQQQVAGQQSTNNMMFAPPPGQPGGGNTNNNYNNQPYLVATAGHPTNEPQQPPQT